MAEPQQVASKKRDPECTNQIFDDDVGEDFLGSWKSRPSKIDMSLDFGNDGPPKAKKKPFSLDKLDADFDFDFSGSFGKLSTFNIDMSDLDFPSPPSKTQKSKREAQEKSEGGKEEEKNDSFKFEFDFKRLDGFDLDHTLLKGKEEKNSLRQNGQSIHTDEYGASILKSKSEASPETINDVSESNETGTSPKEQTVTHSKFNQSVLNMKEVEPPQVVAQSSCTSGFQDVGNSPQKQTSAIKQNLVADSCLFGDLLRQADSNTMKEATNLMESNLPDNVSSPPASSIQSGSGDKLSFENTLLPEVKLTSKVSQEGDQVQCFAKTDPSDVEIPIPDSCLKDSSPKKKEPSKCSLEKHAKECFSKNVAASSAKKIPCVKLNKVIHEDMDDNIKGQVDESQNQESSGKDRHIFSKSPSSKMQREIPTQRSSVPSKLELHCNESTDNQSSGQEINVMTVESASEPGENPLQVLSKMDEMPSLTNSDKKMKLGKASMILQSKSIHQSLKSTRITKDPLQRGSTLAFTITKSSSHMSPQTKSLNLPSLQLTRPIAEIGESQSTLKLMQKRHPSSSKTMKNLSSKMLVGNKIQVFTEQEDTALSLLPQKRKPMEGSNI